MRLQCRRGRLACKPRCIAGEDCALPHTVLSLSSELLWPSRFASRARFLLHLGDNAPGFLQQLELLRISALVRMEHFRRRLVNDLPKAAGVLDDARSNSRDTAHAGGARDEIRGQLRSEIDITGRQRLVARVLRSSGDTVAIH